LKKFFAFIKKPTDVFEVCSIIDFYKINDATIYIMKCPWASYSTTKKYCIYKIKKKVSKLNIKQIHRENFSKIDWLKKLQKFNIVALPTNQFKSFYMIVRKLRSNKIKIISISDGMTDSFSLMRYIFARRINSFFTLYNVFRYFPFKINLSDECFFTLYPLKSCCSKITLPVNKNFLPEKKIIKLLKENKVKNLILSTQTIMDKIAIKQLVAKYQIKNYCHYERGTNFITINGSKIIKGKNIMIAEEILHTNLIKCVYGGLSTTTIYAKVNKIKVNLILKKFKPFFLYYFAKEKFYSIF
jgi:hypothetical protein